MTKSLIARILCLIILLLSGGACLAFDNVLLITIDTLRPDYLSCYGSNKVATPNIDRLASGGVIFKDAVSTAPVTLTSHVSILTGLIPLAHGVHDNGTFYVDKK